MKSADIRSAYVGFFADRGHTVVPSSSLIPGNDPTLLFANSGMVQFKDALAGREQLDYTRATSAQRCVRAGGKHNDLDNVGYTARHQTFFEMLGNFSFGDYFKVEAITWAWEFLTQVLRIDPARLWVTVHNDDLEAENIWIERVGFPRSRITRLGDASNFWTMGDTGPCGPNSEIFFDHGPDVPGGPPGSADEDGDRYVEIWNLVFPQFDLQPDGRRLPLAKRGIDTGMGLERVAAALQGVHSNYETDLFRGVIRAIGAIAGIAAERDMLANASVRVIADHIRATAFLITDGVVPGNEDRNYVLRRIMRRALRHGHKLGISEAFFHKLVEPLSVEMSGAYPELSKAQDRVAKIILNEEERFAETLAQGMEVLDREVRQLTSKTIPGEVVFRLYDTYGFPADLTADIARERNLDVDMPGFDAAMAVQKERGRAASRFGGVAALPQVPGITQFTGYGALKEHSVVTALFRQQGDALERTEALHADESGVVVLANSPFYAEAGGQVGDVGVLTGDGASFSVIDTQPSSGQHLHFGKVVAGHLRVGGKLHAIVDEKRRTATALNHSATHLLHAALRKVLGAHVEQKGSLVNADRLRFDFVHYQTVTPAEIGEVERMVNAEVRRNTTVSTDVLPFDEAVGRGAMALFGEKYGDKVRVLTMGEGFSVELCGGTHVFRTGDIGCFRVTSESGIAAGVRRIEAVTGAAVMGLLDQAHAALEQIAGLVRGNPEDAAKKVQQLVEHNRTLQRELTQIKEQMAASRGVDLADQAHIVSGIKVLAADLGATDAKALLAMLDTLKDKLERAVILLTCVEEGKINLIGGVTKNLTQQFKAGDLVRDIGKLVGAKGGGRPDMARAGGGDRPDALPAALAAVTDWVAARV